jgi:phage gp36-like protein
MIYATRTDMTQRYGERELIALTDRDDTGQINAVVLARALEDAVATVDGFVGKVYRLPLLGCLKPALPATVPPVAAQYVSPPLLTRITCDLARYYLYTDLPDEHEVSRRYKAVMSELDALAKGKTQLVCPWGGSPGTALDADPLESQEVMHSFAPRALNDDSLRGFA